MSPRPGSRTARQRRVRYSRRLLALTVCGAVAVTVVHWLNPGTAAPGTCSVTNDTAQTFTLDLDQARYAATIAGVGLRLGMPDHAVTVALATALQESKLQNLGYGDRDSLGLFQQRPSQGWGTPAQLTDPTYAAAAFYQHLAKVPGWRTLAVTAAAQAVQRSAAPGAYAEWEDEARAFAIAFTGEQAAALTCRNLGSSPAQATVAAAAATELGTPTVTGPQPAQRGWAVSSWLVAQAARFGVAQVCFSERCWTAASGHWQLSPLASGGLSYQLEKA